MFSSLVTTFIRQFTRNFAFSVIGLGGLVVGLLASTLIFAWATYELSYDHYHPENDRVFWVLNNVTNEGEVETTDDAPIQLAEFLRTHIPEVDAVTRMDRTRALLTFGKKEMHESGYYADAELWKVFHGTIVRGNTNNPLPDLHSIAISEETARLLFNTTDVLGKVVEIDRKRDFKVTAVYAAFPKNSSLGGDLPFVLPFMAKQRDLAGDWEPVMVKLTDATTRDAVQKKIDAQLKSIFPDEQIQSYLFCLTDWRLRWNFENGVQTGGRIVYVVVFGITAVFILLMACVNYMNLATARAAKRAREIGVRKMTGATRGALIRQFLMESLALTFIAGVLSVLLLYMFLPLFNQLTRVDLSIPLAEPMLWLGLTAAVLITGILAGAYPAWLLSSMKPATVLKGNFYSSLSGTSLRKGLVVFQFALSIIMVFSALVMWQQMDFLLNKELGFDQRNVLYVEPKHDSHFPIESFKNTILNHPAIVSAGVGAASPMEINGGSEISWFSKRGKEVLHANGASCDADYLVTLGFTLVKGRNFLPNYAADSANFIVNEKAAALLGFDDPIGQTIRYDMYHQQEGKIVGVIKDFHNEDIHLPIDPVVLCLGDSRKYGEWARLFVRYEDGKLDEALAYLKEEFARIQPGIPMTYGFLDEDFQWQFFTEKLLRQLSVFFTLIAIAIACLGLFGLTLFNTQRRTKEIGVRKVLGASAAQVVALLCRDFAKPVLIAFVVALPAGYYLMEKFLQGYAFRTQISIGVFLLVIGGMALLVMLTVSYQSVRAALKNPTDSLKIE